MSKEQKKNSKSHLHRWRWPINLNAYDRSPHLSAKETATLVGFVLAARDGYRGWPANLRSDLVRLITPMKDALDVIKARDSYYSGTMTLLFHEMHQRRSSFWSWDEAIWAQIRPSYDSFDRTRALTQSIRRCLISLGYLFGRVNNLSLFEQSIHQIFAPKVFGPGLIDQAQQRFTAVISSWGYTQYDQSNSYYNQVICKALLMNRSPYLEDLTQDVIHALHQGCTHQNSRMGAVMLSRVLVSLGIIASPLPDPNRVRTGVLQITIDDISPEWLGWSRRWHETSTLCLSTRNSTLNVLNKIGRWLYRKHPDITSPAQWTRELAADFIGTVNRLNAGDWASGQQPNRLAPQPLSAKTKYMHIASVRTFIRDCQEWGWVPRRFDYRRALATPRSIRALIAPNPRVIADDVWAKLLWAGLNLTEADIPTFHPPKGKPQKHFTYPLAMVRAMVHVWLFCGLRNNEFCRLRLGCIRWQREDIALPEERKVISREAICWLDVPVNKTSTAFTKPVDHLVGEAITAWESVRPTQPSRIDPKTGEEVYYLFTYRGNRIGDNFVNKSLIPMLCRKAGLQKSDVRGPLTSHRARATMASMLHNAKEGMSLFEMQQWLGHRSLESTKYYVKTSPAKLAAAFADAGYLERNLRSIKVLIDRDVIRNGDAVHGEPWKFYDLGHGYCSYDFFDQCPHRMACAKCDFYVPKHSSRAQMLEAKVNLQHMLECIPLTDEERAAVEDGIGAMEKLSIKLAEIPTPSGQLPKDLEGRHQRKLPVLARLYPIMRRNTLRPLSAPVRRAGLLPGRLSPPTLKNGIRSTNIA